MFDESEYPKYLRPEVTAELKRRSVQCYPSLAPLFCPENPHAAFAYVDSSRLEHGVCGIEMPLETPLDEFTANVAVLHEIGHIVSEKKKIPRSVWRKEIAAWKCAEKSGIPSVFLKATRGQGTPGMKRSDSPFLPTSHSESALSQMCCRSFAILLWALR